MTKRQITISVIAVVVLFLVIGVGLYLNKKSTVSLNNINFAEMSYLSDSGKVTLKGDLTSSGKAYKDYSYEIEGDKITLTINEVLVNNKNKSGSFLIEIQDDRLKGFDEIGIVDGNVLITIPKAD